MRPLRLGTRRSPLALAQVQVVAQRLGARGVASEIVQLETAGDRHHAEPLSSLGGQGVFAVEIQRALLDEHIDVAVHSAKDLPSQTPDGLVLASVPERRDPVDVLVGRSLAGLGPGASVATGSPRRRALLLEHRPDLHVVELRGNMATRLSRVGQGVDAVVAAAAALERLGVNVSVERLDPEWFVPQVGQGALALEARADDASTRATLAEIDDLDAHRALDCERAFLHALSAGCTVPAGAYARVVDDELELNAVMLAVDGSRSERARRRGTDARALGEAVARYLADERGGRSLAGWA